MQAEIKLLSDSQNKSNVSNKLQSFIIENKQKLDYLRDQINEQELSLKEKH